MFCCLPGKETPWWRRWGDHVVDEEEEGVFRPQGDPLPDEEVELTHCQVGGDQVLLLVQVTDPAQGN